MAANPRNTNDTSSIHRIPMTEEAFEHLIGLESPYRKATGWKRERYVSEETVKLDQLGLELPLALVYEGVF